MNDHDRVERPRRYQCLPPHDHDEYLNLNLITIVLDIGQVHNDGAGTGTISIFAPPSFLFFLSDPTLPLLTTMWMFLRGIVELIWFING